MYSDEVVKKIKSAKSEYEITRIMASARKGEIQYRHIKINLQNIQYLVMFKPKKIWRNRQMPFKLFCDVCSEEIPMVKNYR